MTAVIELVAVELGVAVIVLLELGEALLADAESGDYRVQPLQQRQASALYRPLFSTKVL